MLLIDTYLDKSPIQGIGVFSKENIKKGRKIKERRPEFEIKFDRKNLPQMPLAFANFIHTHSWEDEEDMYVVGIDNEKYMNHSTDPSVDDDGYALKNINIGDEITIDYRDFDDNFEDLLKI